MGVLVEAVPCPELSRVLATTLRRPSMTTMPSSIALARWRGFVEIRWLVALHLGFLIICSGAVLRDNVRGTRPSLLVRAVALACVISATSREPAHA